MGKNQTNKTVLKLTMYDKAEEIEFPLEREFIGILDPSGDLTKTAMFFASKAETFEELVPLSAVAANEALQEQVTELSDDLETLQGQYNDLEARVVALETPLP